MSLNNIELNPRLLAELYPNKLVGDTDVQIIAATEPIMEEHEATSVAPSVHLRHDFKSLGNNQKMFW